MALTWKMILGATILSTFHTIPILKYKNVAIKGGSKGTRNIQD